MQGSWTAVTVKLSAQPLITTMNNVRRREVGSAGYTIVVRCSIAQLQACSISLFYALFKFIWYDEGGLL